jgi:DNA-binding NtrC family response regulator
VGDSPALLQMKKELVAIARSSAPVLVNGETGTGKELVAHALHEESPRAKGPFVAINVRELPETLVESELFGHVKGAFTGADANKTGLIRRADGGTFFLDEIGEMPLAAQAMLLRVLQEKEVRPVGGASAEKVDVRIVAATHRDLRQLVKDGAFREDLLYRLEVLKVVVPPLRARGEDVVKLAEHYVERFAADEEKPVAPSLDDSARAALAKHRWPGNVRELQNAIRRAVIVGTNPITAVELALGSKVIEIEKPIRLMREVSENEIEKALEKTGGNVSHALKLLGVSRSAFYRERKRREQQDL